MAFIALYKWFRDFRKRPFYNPMGIFRDEWYSSLTPDEVEQMKRIKNEYEHQVSLLRLCTTLGIMGHAVDPSGKRFCNPDFRRNVRNMIYGDQSF